MGIDPTIWGSKMWAMIHLISLQAPENIDANVRNSYYMFFTMMPYVLPCDKCREHWLEHVRQHPIEDALDTRDDLFRWSVDMHNLVNRSLGKPEVSYDAALEHWTGVSRGSVPTAQCIDAKSRLLPTKTIMIGMAILAIVLLILFIAYTY
jgi:FAD-linked sulfhydryl oxidase